MLVTDSSVQARQASHANRADWADQADAGRAADGVATAPVPDVVAADKCVVLDAVESTNTQARKMLSDSIVADPARFPLYVLLADEQTGGRGRMGRTWVSGRDTSFLSSFVARIPTALATGANSGWLTTIAGIDTVESLRALAGAHGADPERIGLKWPNDVYWDDYKLGGILTELAAVHAGPADDAVVIFGIGINLFLKDRPTEIATSLHRHVPGLPAYAVLRNQLAQLIAQRLRTDLLQYCEKADAGIPRLLKRATALSCTLGRHVSAELPGGTRVTGTACAILPNAALKIRADDGTFVSVTAGDVGLIPQAMPVPQAATVPEGNAPMPAHSLRLG